MTYLLKSAHRKEARALNNYAVLSNNLRFTLADKG